MKTLGIIPARYASTRFPGKPLVDIAGKSMIQRVYEQVAKASSIEEIIVATDDARIHEHVLAFGGRSMMTSEAHRSGTDRCAEVATQNPGFEAVVNIQGDEPFIDPGQIDQLVAILQEDPAVQIATLAKRIDQQEQLFSPNVVKVVFNNKGRALYFSRSTIPFMRGVEQAHWLKSGIFYKHLGLYGFRHSVLLDLHQLPPGQYEQFESLEQLRWLQEGYFIQIEVTEQETIGIDSPEDLEQMNKRYNL